MATVLIPGVGKQWAVNVLAAPTELYLYVSSIQESESRALLGWVDQAAGTFHDGPLTDYFQGLGVSNHAVDLTTVVMEIDDDTNSPFKGRRRLKFIVGASVA